MASPLHGRATYLPPNPFLLPLGDKTDIRSPIAAATPTAIVIAPDTTPKPKSAPQQTSGLGADSARHVVEFADGNFPGGDRVYNAETLTQEFSWTLLDGANVRAVEWLSTRDPDGEAKVIGKSSVNTSSKWFNWVDSTSARLNLDYLSPDGRESRFLGTYMAIRVSWDTEQDSGSTQSGIFSVAADAVQKAALEKPLGDVAEASEQARDGVESTSTQALGSPSPTPLFSEATSPPSSTATLDTGAGLQGSDPSSSHEGGGGGGLATGAIVGIAVGVGLVVIVATAALIWFILRKRRQRKLAAGGYDGKAGSSHFIDDKQPHAQVTESNHRYSEDHLGRAHNETPLVGAHNDGSTGDAAPDEGRPGGVSRNVAHLVEDGMTQDEIRQLEAEERHLDDEIERAARR